MLSNVKNIFKVEDLRNKLLFTFAMIAVYRFGASLRVPGIDAQAVRQLREASNSQGALGFLNLFSGGAFGSFSIFALGIMPYITASIIMQVLGVVIPKLEKWQQEGATGQRKITQWTRYVAIGIATLQGAGLTFIFGQGNGSAFLGAAATAPGSSPDPCPRCRQPDETTKRVGGRSGSRRSGDVRRPRSNRNPTARPA